MKRKFEKQAVNRICSYLLTTAMVVGGLTLSPIDTMEVQAATVKNVTLGTQAFSTGVNESTAATVYYGSDGANPIAWRVIGYDGNGVASSSGTATLFAAKNLSGLIQFDSNGTTESNASNQYSSSNLKTQVESYVDKLTAAEAGAVAKRTLAVCSQTGVDHKDHNCEGITGTKVDNAVMWPLSTAEAVRVPKSLRDEASYWWLRFPGQYTCWVAFVRHRTNVAEANGVNPAGGLSINNFAAVRPAFNLTLSSVRFSSASGASKSNPFAATTDGSGISSWTLTLGDTDSSFDAELPSEGTAGTSITVSVGTAGSGTVDYNQTSAMLVDEHGTVVAYGKIGDIATGEKTFTIPNSISAGTYTLNVFPEQVNGNNKTDYAGQVASASITIAAAPSTVSDVTGQESGQESGQSEEKHSNPETAIPQLKSALPTESVLVSIVDSDGKAGTIGLKVLKSCERDVNNQETYAALYAVQKHGKSAKVEMLWSYDIYAPYGATQAWKQASRIMTIKNIGVKPGDIIYAEYYNQSSKRHEILPCTVNADGSATFTLPMVGDVSTVSVFRVIE